MPIKKKTTANRFAILNAFIDFTIADLRRSEMLVWLTLYRDTRDGIASSSQQNIARRAGLSRKTVERAIKSLAKRGLLHLVHLGGLNRGSSRYRVLPMSREKFDSL
jgi:DNA-binding MarR family transcriptional regulator